jgi:acyl-CoA thioesterase FadM
MPSYELPLTHRPMRDGTPVTSRHVPYFLAAEVLAQAWARTLSGLGPGLLTSKDVAVVHASFDFGRELFTGTATFGVVVEKVGSTSIRFGLTIHQGGHLAATGTTTVVHTDEARTRSIPLSPAQRAALEAA